MFFKVPNAFDSHGHFLATGQVACGLSLKSIRGAADLRNLQIKPEHYQQNWLTGFGWDQNLFPDGKFPTAEELDSVFPNTPVLFSRIDGHASWINTSGMLELEKLGYDFSKDPPGGKILRDESGKSTGILFDQAHIQALIKLPPFSPEQQKLFIKKSQTLFNQGGFSHMRDLSMNWELWQLLTEMSQRKDLTIAIESFVTVENLNDLPRVFQEIETMKKNPNAQLRIQGVKLFLDGSLGSQTAYLSQNYLGTDSRGILCWDLQDVKQVLKSTWQKGYEFAVHTIGDEAVHQMVRIAREVSAEGVLGRLHLEHVELLRHETIQMMKPLHIVCHMQPCHWLSDQVWLSKTLPTELVKSSFQWDALRRNKIPFFFGCDAPIEPTSLIRNIQALRESAKAGWPSLQSDWQTVHSHPDKNWCPSWTEGDDDKIKQVYFLGEPVL